MLFILHLVSLIYSPRFTAPLVHPWGAQHTVLYPAFVRQMKCKWKEVIGTVQINTTTKAGTLPQLLIFVAAISISSSALKSARALPEKCIVDLKTEPKARECLELGRGGQHHTEGKTGIKMASIHPVSCCRVLPQTINQLFTTSCSSRSTINPAVTDWLSFPLPKPANLQGTTRWHQSKQLIM